MTEHNKKVTATVKRGNDVTELDGWQLAANAYTVKLRYDGRTMKVPFWTGSAWTRPPTAADVMGSVCSEASMVVNAATFEDFAAELGYDPDSRKAERDYHGLVAQTDQLRVLLGDDFDAFVFADEDELQARCQGGRR